MSFFAIYPPGSGGGGGGGVSTINGLSGAITLAAGSGITITPSGNTLTIAASGGGGGANTALSNLIATSINQDLLPDSDGVHSLGDTGKEWRFATIGMLKDNDGGDSVSPDSHQLFDAVGNILVDFGNTNRLLLGNPLLQWPLADGTVGQAIVTDGAGVLSFATVSGGGGANTALSNLITTSINQNLIPNADLTFDLGSLSNRWANIYVTAVNANGFGLQLTSGSTTFQFPTTDGTAGQTIVTDGGGILSFASPGGSFADQQLSNLSGTTSIPVDLLPTTTAVTNLGSNSKAFLGLFLKGYIRDSGNKKAIGINNTGSDRRKIFDTLEVSSGDFANRNLNNAAGSAVLNWSNQTLTDSSGAFSIEWNSRLLDDPGSVVQLSWNTGLKLGAGQLLFPAADGTVGQVLTTDGAGTLSFTTPASSGANTALSNLSSTAVNVDISPAADNTVNLGNVTNKYVALYAYKVTAEAGSLSLTSNSVNYSLPTAQGTTGQVLTTDGVAGVSQLSWSTPAGSGANTFLSNLTSPTAINQDLKPDTTNTRSLGQTTNQWLNACFFRQTSTSIAGTEVLSSGPTLSGIYTGAPSPGAGVTFFNAAGTVPLYFETQPSSVADANPTNDIHIRTGNKTAGTGNSGTLFLEAGTSSGGTQGKVAVVGRSLALPSASADPSVAAAGDIYYNTTVNKIKMYNGTTWETVTSV